MALIAFVPVLALGAGFLVGRRSRAGGNNKKAEPAHPRDETLPRFIPTPHPQWKAPEPQAPPWGDDGTVIQVDPDTTDAASLYAFAISAVVPRPVGFVSSVSASGQVNLSPYSYFAILNHNPPVVALGCCRSALRASGKKDSITNIEGTGEFVLNMMSEWFVEAANHTCGDFPPDVDEFEESGLTPVASLKVKPPRVKESAVQMECKVLSIQEIPDKSGKPAVSIVLGQVVLFHVAEAVTARSPTGKLVVDPVALRPVSRLGGLTYGLTTRLFNLHRPSGKGEYPNGQLEPRE